jgi:hypothetical protein
MFDRLLLFQHVRRPSSTPHTNWQASGFLYNRNVVTVARRSPMKLRPLILLLPFAVTTAFADPLTIQGPEQSQIDTNLPDGGLPPAIGVRNIQVFRASRDKPDLTDGKGWTYNHHVDMACWKGRLYVAWSSGEKDEDTWRGVNSTTLPLTGSPGQFPPNCSHKASRIRCGCISFTPRTVGCSPSPDSAVAKSN